MRDPLATAGSLWRIERIEFDAFNQSLLTLRPTVLTGDLPTLKLDAISNSLARQEISAQYEELQKAIASHSYRAVVTYSRNLAEKIAHHQLEKGGKSAGRDLNGSLETIRKQRAAAKDELPWFSDLVYHIAHRIRLIHARTHLDRTEKVGRSIDSGLALSCVEDLKELLRESGLCYV